MPFREPLTTAQLQEIQERNRNSADVFALLWEIKRLRATVLRADQARRSNLFTSGLIVDLLKADLDKEPVAIERRVEMYELRSDQLGKPPMMR